MRGGWGCTSQGLDARPRGLVKGLASKAEGLRKAYMHNLHTCAWRSIACTYQERYYSHHERKLYNITLKTHNFWHMAEQGRWSNPRGGWCYADERFMGLVARAAAAVAKGGIHALGKSFPKRWFLLAAMPNPGSMLATATPEKGHHIHACKPAQGWTRKRTTQAHSHEIIQVALVAAIPHEAPPKTGFWVELVHARKKHVCMANSCNSACEGMAISLAQAPVEATPLQAMVGGRP
jgi:hypothetical protein